MTAQPKPAQGPSGETPVIHKHERPWGATIYAFFLAIASVAAVVGGVLILNGTDISAAIKSFTNFDIGIQANTTSGVILIALGLLCFINSIGLIFLKRWGRFLQISLLAVGVFYSMTSFCLGTTTSFTGGLLNPTGIIVNVVAVVLLGYLFIWFASHVEFYG